jgi:hypothetical protein
MEDAENSTELRKRSPVNMLFLENKYLCILNLIRKSHLFWKKGNNKISDISTSKKDLKIENELVTVSWEEIDVWTESSNVGLGGSIKKNFPKIFKEIPPKNIIKKGLSYRTYSGLKLETYTLIFYVKLAELQNLVSGRIESLCFNIFPKLFTILKATWWR